MWKSKLKSTLQVFSLLILQATAHSTERREGMMCSADESQLMRLFMQLLKAKKVIEIGKIYITVWTCVAMKATRSACSYYS